MTNSGFKNLPVMAKPPGLQGGGRLKVCVVTSEFLGPVKNGGIGTATSGLLSVLRAAGHAVNLLYTLVANGAPHAGDQPWQHWVDELSEQGIEVHFISHEGQYRDWRRKSWLVAEFLRRHDFDVVYFNEHHGSGFYSLAAKRAGEQPFAGQTHCVITHGSMEWVFDINDQYMTRPTDLEMCLLERKSVEWADYVISPSRYLLGKYAEYGWGLPLQTFHQPLPLAIGSPASDGSRRFASELVFFGRLEARKGLWLFCSALDLLQEELRGRTVTFLGRMTEENGLSTGALLLARAKSWPFRIRMITTYDQEQALDFLRNGERLAIMPSLADNSPCVVYECLRHGIPFLATSGSGAEELVLGGSSAPSLSPPEAGRLAEAIRQAFKKGVPVSRPAFDDNANLTRWAGFHAFLADSRKRNPARSMKPSGGTAGVMIDYGELPLAAVLRACAGGPAFKGCRKLVVLSHRKPLLDAVLEAAPARGSPEIKVVAANSSVVKNLLEVVKGCGNVVFFPLGAELSPGLWDKAASALAAQPAVSFASAAVAAERAPDLLPVGDLPALARLGYPACSDAWAVRTQVLKDLATPACFHDALRARAVPCREAGAALFQRITEIGLGVALSPHVGVIWQGSAPAPAVPEPTRSDVIGELAVLAAPISNASRPGEDASPEQLRQLARAGKAETVLLNAARHEDRKVRLRNFAVHGDDAGKRYRREELLDLLRSGAEAGLPSSSDATPFAIGVAGGMVDSGISLSARKKWYLADLPLNGAKSLVFRLRAPSAMTLEVDVWNQRSAIRTVSRSVNMVRGEQDVEIHLPRVSILATVGVQISGARNEKALLDGLYLEPC